MIGIFVLRRGFLDDKIIFVSNKLKNVSERVRFYRERLISFKDFFI